MTTMTSVYGHCWIFTLAVIACVFIPGSVSTSSDPSSSIRDAVNSCVTQYLAELWQGKRYFTLSETPNNFPVSRSEVCEEERKASTCVRKHFDAFELPLAARDETVKSLLPQLPGLSLFCQETDFKDCSTERFKGCAKILPTDLNVIKGESYTQLCPKLRVADGCFEEYRQCHVNSMEEVPFFMKSLKDIFGEGDDAFLSCNDGEARSVEKLDNVRNPNATSGFHCETAYVPANCRLTLNSKGSGNMLDQTTCDQCGWKLTDCPNTMFFNFSSSKCEFLKANGAASLQATFTLLVLSVMTAVRFSSKYVWSLGQE